MRAIREKVAGPSAESLNALAWLYHKQGSYTAAEPLYARALAIRGKALGSEHPTTIMVRNNYARLRRERQRRRK